MRFFSKRLIVRRGIRQAFALVFLNVATRRVWISPTTCNLTDEWMKQQAKAFLAFAQRESLPVGIVTRDNDRNYRRAFDMVFVRRDIRMLPLAFRAPNLNAFVERFIQTIQSNASITSYLRREALRLSREGSMSNTITRSGLIKDWATNCSLPNHRPMTTNCLLARCIAQSGSVGY